MLPQAAVADTAPFLLDGPVAVAAQSVVSAARMLGAGHWASVTRAWCVPYLFNQMERIFATDEEPTAAVNQTLDTLTRYLLRAASLDLCGVGESAEPWPPAGAREAESAAAIRDVTGEHYGQLFKTFSERSYWDEPARLLRERLERNGVEPALLRGQSVLDTGCGGGRYTVAWRLLGAAPVVGLDTSPVNIADARRRCAEARLDEMEFDTGDVLDLPFGAASFDVVFSNGVLHHTTDWRKGIAELVRVLRPGGLGWLYLIERPGGLFWDIIELLREVMRGEERETARQALRLLRIPANRIFYMLDHVLAPINIRLTPAEIEACLRRSGAVQIRRLTRGADFDRVEQIHKGAPDATVKYGVGENRYVFSRE